MLFADMHERYLVAMLRVLRTPGKHVLIGC
jgi:hypothetical protein